MYTCMRECLEDFLPDFVDEKMKALTTSLGVCMCVCVDLDLVTGVQHEPNYIQNIN